MVVLIVEKKKELKTQSNFTSIQFIIFFQINRFKNESNDRIFLLVLHLFQMHEQFLKIWCNKYFQSVCKCVYIDLFIFFEHFFNNIFSIQLLIFVKLKERLYLDICFSIEHRLVLHHFSNFFIRFIIVIFHLLRCIIVHLVDEIMDIVKIY